MQAARPAAFALKASGLDTFLYADVGAEANGSTLTILSILARLGKDPWAEAARWAALPKAAVIDSLAQSIAQMPLAPSALAGARDSAARLVQLLPTNTHLLGQASAIRAATATPNLVPFAVLYFAFSMWMALNIFSIFKPAAEAPAPIRQSAAVAPVASTQAVLAGSSDMSGHP